MSRELSQEQDSKSSCFPSADPRKHIILNSLIYRFTNIWYLLVPSIIVMGGMEIMETGSESWGAQDVGHRYDYLRERSSRHITAPCLSGTW